MKKEKIKAKCHERAFCNSRGFSDDSSKESKEKTLSGQRPFFCFLFFSPFFSFSLTTQCKIISYGYRKECIKFLRHECESLHPREMPERCPALRNRGCSRCCRHLAERGANRANESMAEDLRRACASAGLCGSGEIRVVQDVVGDTLKKARVKSLGAEAGRDEGWKMGRNYSAFIGVFLLCFLNVYKRGCFTFHQQDLEGNSAADLYCVIWD